MDCDKCEEVGENTEEPGAEEANKKAPRKRSCLESPDGSGTVGRARPGHQVLVAMGCGLRDGAAAGHDHDYEGDSYFESDLSGKPS
jgi:hypothetical protein